MLIAIEGIDASGKETQTKLLVERLRTSLEPANGFVAVERLAFPDYETVTGKVIREMLRGEIAVHEKRENEQTYADYCAPRTDAQALALQALMAANRYERTYDLRVAHGNGVAHLVCDRYWLSGLVYGAADGLDVEWLRAVHSALPRADITLYLDITIEESFKRRPKREDAFEANVERLKNVRRKYHNCCDARMAEFVNGVGTVEKVAERIWESVSPLFRGLLRTA